MNAERKKEEKERDSYSNTDLDKMKYTLNMRKRIQNNSFENTLPKKPYEENKRIIKSDLFISNGQNAQCIAAHFLSNICGSF